MPLTPQGQILRRVGELKHLKAARLSMGLSQQKLAERIGFSQQTIYQYENGITQPDLSTLKKLADCLHTTTDYLTGYSDLPCPPGNPGFTSEEYQLLQRLRQLSPGSRQAICILVEELSGRED